MENEEEFVYPKLTREQAEQVRTCVDIELRSGSHYSDIRRGAGKDYLPEALRALKEALEENDG